ncbi:phosphoenolpyruvate--protein phosphotransferase, partial [Streptomyces sp. SID10244]|nr:phosphoenolpyruvate--protein phosphotransferase [Streptomyces sp. SID10244]
TSHTAIIARQLGIPCVVAVGELATVAVGTTVLVDGTAGTLEIEPDEAVALAGVDESRRKAAAVASWTGPGTTSDGHRVSVLANVADGASARNASGHPVEGVGLFRTELAFLERAEA